MTVQELTTKLIRIELSRRKFWHFCLYYDLDFFTKRPFLKEIADGFQKIFDGEIRSMSVSLPPASGKSYICTLFSAWGLGMRPTGSIMRNTCTAHLYQKFSYDTREAVRSEKFKDVFPGIALADDKQNLSGWSLNKSKRVAYFGAGVGGTVIGFHCTIVAITDDLYSNIHDALSPTVNEKTTVWNLATHNSRLEKGCPTIDMGTRWSKNDTIGRKMEAKKYDLSIVISALDKNDRSFCEEVKSTEEYLEIRNDCINANQIEIWFAEYMQEPAEVQGLLFRKSDIKRFTMEEFVRESTNEKGESIVETRLGFIDPAEGGGDNLAFPAGQIIPQKVFITDVVYTRDTVDISVPRCAAQIDRLEIDYIKVEINGLGSGVYRDLRRLVKPTKLIPIKNATHKETRIWNEYASIQKHFYFLAESEYIPGSDYDRFMRCIFSYMKIGENQEDDAPDAIAGLSRFIQQHPAAARLLAPQKAKAVKA